MLFWCVWKRDFTRLTLVCAMAMARPWDDGIFEIAVLRTYELYTVGNYVDQLWGYLVLFIQV